MPPRSNVASGRPRFGWRLGVAATLIVVLGVAAVFVSMRPVPTPPAPAAPVEEPKPTVVRAVIGTSVEGRAIESFTYGNGDTNLLFVGGIHGGYEWNSVVLAYGAMDYFNLELTSIPENVSVTVVPNANPDAVAPIAIEDENGRIYAWDVLDAAPGGALRFNANGVDLNRNFACKWQPEAMWRGNPVSAGTEAFSEPESRAIRDLALRLKPALVVFWHSQAGAVYASECEGGILPETLAAMNVYATAAGYRAVESFDAYPVTGDAEGWLASVGIPAITVELTTHEDSEWGKNFLGIMALLDRYR